jgi:polyhydroxybutyrate depolymerase
MCVGRAELREGSARVTWIGIITMRYRRAVVLLLHLTAACAGGTGGTAPSVPTEPPPATPPFPVGQMSDQTIVVGGVTRQFRVHVPAGTTTPKAVVFVLHGGGGEGLDVSVLGQHALSVFRTVADREGFVVVYPAGLPANDAQRLVGWVDCRADNTVASAADDIGFLAALVERVRAAYGLTSARLFMTGGSNGAQMTHAFAFHRADLVGAVATGAGSLPVTPKAGACTSGPSRTVLSPPNPLTGIQNRDIEFAEVVWAFFRARLP